MAAQRAGGTVAEASALPLSLRLGNAIMSYAAYIGKTFWPANLAVFYPHPEHSLPWREVSVSAVILIAITMMVLYFRRLRYPVMGWTFFVITLIPVIGIVQVGRQSMADRYAYVPCIGVFIIVAWGLDSLAHATAFTRIMAAAAALCMIFGFATVTTRYLPYWQNGVELFTHARVVAGQPDSALEEDLADALFAAGRVDDAFHHYSEACSLRPGYATCHYNMAEILFNRHQLRDALEQYQFAGSLTAGRDMALASLINSSEILLELGDFEAAERSIAAALQIDPNNNTALLLQRRAASQMKPGN
jgi:hypothetical protein